MAATADTVARVYALSLFELAQDAGGREKILEVAGELEQIIELARSNTQFANFLDSPVVDTQRRGASIRSIFQDRITDLVLRFMLVLNTNKRLDHIDAVHSAFAELVYEAIGQVEVDVWTAVAMSDEVLQTVTNGLQNVLGKDPVVHAYVDASILGGLKIRVGDKLIDGSIAARLRQLEQSIRTGAAHRIAASVESFTEGSPS